MPELKAQAREVWRLSLPAILTQITTIAMQYIDSAMVGRLGANASAAIGLVASSTWLMNGVCYALAAGFSVQVAHRIGAGNARGARSVEKNGLLAGLLVSGLLCLLGSLIHAHLPVWLKGDAEITYDAGRYFLTFAWMLPFTQFCSLSASFFTPPCIFSARIVATTTTADGRRPAVRHFMSRNFSAPRSAPKPASVTA